MQLNEIWTVFRGAYWQADVELYSDEACNVAFDLSGCTVAGEIVWSGGTLSLTEENDRIVVADDRTKGRLEVLVDEADNLVVPLGQLSRRRLWVIDAGGKKRRTDNVWINVKE